MKKSTSNSKSFNIVDSITPVNKLIDKVDEYFEEMPIAWGRYFTTQVGAEYSHRHENYYLNKHKIKLLPLARHTDHVGGSKEQGITDAIQGVNDLFATFTLPHWKSQGSEFFFFLDVEGGKGINGSISKDYYKAWSETLISYSEEKSENAVTILPCVYANYHDEETFSILLDLKKEEKKSCYGLWIARYYSLPKKCPSWDDGFAVPKILREDPLIPVFLRQYQGGSRNEKFDLNQTNPDISNLKRDFLDKLILPPPSPSS